MKSPIKKRSRERVNITCGHCKKIFDVKNYRKDICKYCSRKCKAFATRIQIKANCAICEKEFEHISSRANKAKYCSQKCYHKSQIGKGTVEFKCTHCNKIFLDSPSRERKYCSKQCVNKAEKSVWKAVYSTVRRNMLTRGMLDKCQLCGFDKYKQLIGVHHIDGNRHNNDLSNLMVLCPTCHSIQHMKHIVH